MAKDKITGLTDKQERFCQEYLIDLNGTQAAIRAGFSEKTANEQAARMLANVSIQDKIAEIRKSISEEIKVDQKWVLNRFIEISERCMQAKPVMVREGRNIVQKTDENGDGVWEFDSAGANKATENIGKHLGFYETDNKQRVVTPPTINILPPSKD